MCAARVFVAGTLLALMGSLLLLGLAIRSLPNEVAQRSSCSGVSATRAAIRGQVVMVVHAGECVDRDGRLLSASASVDRLSRTVWPSLRTPVDGFVADVAGTADGPVTRTLSRAELMARLGAGPSGVVLPVVAPEPGELLWLLLPAGFVAAFLGLFWMVWRARASGLMVFWFRR